MHGQGKGRNGVVTSLGHRTMTLTHRNTGIKILLRGMVTRGQTGFFCVIWFAVLEFRITQEVPVYMI